MNEWINEKRYRIKKKKFFIFYQTLFKFIAAVNNRSISLGPPPCPIKLARSNPARRLYVYIHFA